MHSYKAIYYTQANSLVSIIIANIHENFFIAGPTTVIFTIKPQNLTVYQSGRAAFHCSVHSVLKPNFAWNYLRKGASKAETIASKRGPLSVDYTIIPGQSSQTLLITNVQWRHEGVYKCIVSSGNRHIQAEANLHVPSEYMVVRYYAFRLYL